MDAVDIALLYAFGTSALFMAVMLWWYFIHKTPPMTVEGYFVIDEEDDMARLGAMAPGRYHLEIAVPSRKMSDPPPTSPFPVELRFSGRPRTAVKPPKADPAPDAPVGVE